MTTIKKYLETLTEAENLSPYQKFVKMKLAKWGFKSPLEIKDKGKAGIFWAEVKKDWAKQKMKK